MAEVFGITIGKKPEPEGPPTPPSLEEMVKETRSFRPSEVGVDLLPRYVRTRYESRALRNKFVIAGSALAIMFAGAWGVGSIVNKSNEGEIATYDSQTQEMNMQASALAPYQSYTVNVDAKRETMYTRMSTDLNAGSAASAFSNAANSSGSNITQYSINITHASPEGDPMGGGSSDCPSPDPFNTTESIGCITFSGTAPGSENVAQLVGALNGTEGFADAYIPSISTAQGGEGQAQETTFSGSVAFDATLRSGRYDDLANPIVNTAAPADPAADAEAPVDDSAPLD